VPPDNNFCKIKFVVVTKNMNINNKIAVIFKQLRISDLSLLPSLQKPEITKNKK